MGITLSGVAQRYSERPALLRLIDAVRTAGQRGLCAPDMTDQVQTIVNAEDGLKAVQARAEQTPGGVAAATALDRR